MLEAINEDENHALGVMVKDGRLKHLNASAWGVTDKAQSYLLLMLVMEDLDVTLKQWKGLPTWNPLAQTVVVFMIPMETSVQKEKQVREVFEKLFEQGIINANVIYQMQDNDKRIVSETWFPYFGSGCAKSVENIFEIDECIVTEEFDEATNETMRYDNLTEINEGLFPKIPSTFHGCPIHVSVIAVNCSCVSLSILFVPRHSLGDLM
jgi:hypothetical protein